MKSKEKMLAELLNNNVLFCTTRAFEFAEERSRTVVLYVLCSDIFVPGADAEDIPEDEIETLYEFWKPDKAFGPIKWVCLRRRLRPMERVVDEMKKHGVWGTLMEQGLRRRNL